MPEEVGGLEGEAQWVSLPLGEFENLHEEIRILREQIERLQIIARGYRDSAAREVEQARLWRAVVAQTHMDGGASHRHPYHQCEHSLCVAARANR